MNLKSRYDLWIVEGGFGTGKTIFLVLIASLLHKSYNKVYANFTLKNIPNFVPIETYNKETIESLEKDSIVLVSEAYHYIDRRESMRPKNIETSQSLQQIRKDKYLLICDVFSARMVDFRFLNASTMIIRALGDAENLFDIKNANLKFMYEFGKYIPEIDDFVYNSSAIIDMNEISKNYETAERIYKKKEFKKLIEY